MMPAARSTGFDLRMCVNSSAMTRIYAITNTASAAYPTVWAVRFRVSPDKADAHATPGMVDVARRSVQIGMSELRSPT